ncbi:hypothetical protein [Sorangium sp. So ce861]|uniref:hypothetical protein n=1 Tax=Sorangium sp. So ce861 TaxID=3133323 RepID=UPI003F624C2B
MRLIGYWRSTADPLWPDPAWFVDESWASSERTRVLAYLRDGVPLWATGGHSWCRFRCGIHACGSAEAQALSYPGLLERLAGGGAVPVLSGAFEEPIPHEISELEAAGLFIEFLPDRGEG